MKPTDADRDPAFERLIARGLAREADATGNACPDADLLAAWFDRSLSVSETERVETHASSCASCQQILADLARSEPPVLRAAPVPEPSRPWHWHWRWLVPVATAAVVFVLATRPLWAPQGPGDMESVRAKAQAEMATRAASAQPIPNAEQAIAQGGTRSPAEERNAAPPAAPAPQVAGGAAAVFPQRLEQKQAAAAKETGPVATRADRPAAPSFAGNLQVAPIQGGAGAENKPLAAPGRMADARQQLGSAAGSSGAAGGAGVPKTAADAVGRLEESVAIVAAPAPAPSVVAMKATGMKAESAIPLIPSVAFAPGGKVAWRVGLTGSIDRSADGGRTWSRQGSGVTTDLGAVSAPGDTVCWAAGADGVVLRTVDGSTWERVTPPARVLFVSVRASSLDAATVKASDGSEFTTTDGGRTWLRTK